MIMITNTQWPNRPIWRYGMEVRTNYKGYEQKHDQQRVII